MKTFRLTCAAALAFVFAHAGAAYALDPEAAAKAFLTPAQTPGQEMSIAFGSVDTEGSDIVIKNAKTSIVNSEKTMEIATVSEIRLLDVSEAASGQYSASGAVYTNMVVDAGGVFSVTMPKMTIDDLRTRDSSADKFPMPVVYRSAIADNVSIDVVDPKLTIAVAQVAFKMDEFTNDLPNFGELSITGIDVPLSAFPPGPTSPAALGYEGNLVFSITGSGRARYESSGFALDDLTIAGDKIGSLSFALDLDNYPNLLNATEINPMELMNIVVNSLSLKYTDDSFAVRVLDMIASQQGMDREQYAQQMAMALPFMLSAINNQDFQKEVADAAGSFLTNPGTIEVNVKPATPMSAGQIMGIAQSAPHTLPDELNVTVKAR